MYLWQCFLPIPGSTHPSTLMLSTSAGFFFRRFAFEFTCCILFISRFLTWAFHIFFYDIAYEPEGWPWKPVSIFVSSSLVQNSFRKFDTLWFHTSIFGVHFTHYVHDIHHLISSSVLVSSSSTDYLCKPLQSIHWISVMIISSSIISKDRQLQQCIRCSFAMNFAISLIVTPLSL